MTQCQKRNKIGVLIQEICLQATMPNRYNAEKTTGKSIKSDLQK